MTCSAEEGSEVPARKRRREGVSAASLRASTLTEALLLSGRLYIRRRETAPRWGVARLALGNIGDERSDIGSTSGSF